jgi:hypothetical protein
MVPTQRLDPAVMQVMCTQAGTFLARSGRPEVSNCIAGLEQYSYSYVEAGDYAAEMKRVYSNVKSGEIDFNHMANLVPRVTIQDAGNPMAMDVTENGSLVRNICSDWLCHLTISYFQPATSDRLFLFITSKLWTMRTGLLHLSD